MHGGCMLLAHCHRFHAQPCDLTSNHFGATGQLHAVAGTPARPHSGRQGRRRRCRDQLRPRGRRGLRGRPHAPLAGLEPSRRFPGRRRGPRQPRRRSGAAGHGQAAAGHRGTGERRDRLPVADRRCGHVMQHPTQEPSGACNDHVLGLAACSSAQKQACLPAYVLDNSCLKCTVDVIAGNIDIPLKVLDDFGPHFPAGPATVSLLESHTSLLLQPVSPCRARLIKPCQKLLPCFHRLWRPRAAATSGINQAPRRRLPARLCITRQHTWCVCYSQYGTGRL